MNVNVDDLVVDDALGDIRTGFCRFMVEYSIDDKTDGISRFSIPHRREILDQYSAQSGLRGFCVLAADGGARWRSPFPLAKSVGRESFAEWVYEDGQQLLPVQDWVTKNDGKYLALFLYVCNPLNFSVRSRRSIVFTPDAEYSVFEHGKSVNVRMYIPGEGYCNDIPQRKITPLKLLSEFYTSLKLFAR